MTLYAVSARPPPPQQVGVLRAYFTEIGSQNPKSFLQYSRIGEGGICRASATTLRANATNSINRFNCRGKDWLERTVRAQFGKWPASNRALCYQSSSFCAHVRDVWICAYWRSPVFGFARAGPRLVSENPNVVLNMKPNNQVLLYVRPELAEKANEIVRGVSEHERNQQGSFGFAPGTS